MTASAHVFTHYRHVCPELQMHDNDCRLAHTLQKAFVKALERAATGLLISTKRCKLGSPTAAFTSCTVASLLQPKSSSCINHKKHAPPVHADNGW